MIDPLHFRTGLSIALRLFPRPRSHLIIGLGAAVVVGIPAPASAQTPPVAQVTEHEVELGEGRSYTYESGILPVAQNRARPGGPVFRLAFYRFPALPGADPSVPAVVMLNGGPGWPGFFGELRPAFLEDNIFPVARVADVIVVGQRGIGTSTPNTVCRAVPDASSEAGLGPRAREEALVEGLEACRRHWEEAGVDLSGITVVEAAADVKDVVTALGYEQVQIRGGSFGSHWGMAVLRFHPEIVARAVLNGMEGPDHTYDMPGWVLAALERAANDAEASGRLDGRIPAGGMIEGFRALAAGADAAPLAARIPDPAGSDSVVVEIGGEEVRGLWRGYSAPSGNHPMASWPADLIRLVEGDLEEAATAVLTSRARAGFLPTAAFFMLDCGSGISPARLQQLVNDPGAEVVGNLGAFYMTACPAWEADLGDDFRSGFQTDIPTLIVHGNWDTSTPLENALELRPYFTNHHFVLVERGTHGAMGEAMRASPDFADAVTRFLSDGDLSTMPDTVTLPPVEWVVPPQRPIS